MRVVGVVAEYNPFHRGHAHHLQTARRLAGADAVVAVMSGCFVQRGDAALLSPGVRARMALSAGADAVILLPCLWSVRDAEHFALGGVSLLSSLGVDAISFGAETADKACLRQAAHLMEHPPEIFSAQIKTHLAAGLPYPAAVSRASAAVLPEFESLLQSPNNTLAVCYLRAMMRQQSSMDVFPVQREGSYNATALADTLPSATAVRGAVLRGDWPHACAALPDSCVPLLLAEAAAGRTQAPNALSQALLYRLHSMDEAAWATLPGLSEGLEDRLRAAARICRDRESLLSAAKTRRYPRARLSRLCTHALLGITQNDLEETPLPPAALVLGIRRGSEKLLSHLSTGRIPLLTRTADFPHARWLDIESLAWDLWGLPAGMETGMLYRQGVIRE